MADSLLCDVWYILTPSPHTPQIHRQIEYIPSSIMNRRGLAMAKKMKETKEIQKKTHRTILQKWYSRVRIRVMAVASLLRLRSRGHNMHTLEAAGCGLGPFSLQVLAHGLSDNHNMGTVILAENAVGHSEYEKVDNSTLSKLLTESRLQHLSLRSCGIFEHNVEAMVRAMNKSTVHLHSVDLSGNYLGPTGANMVASLHSFFVDQLSIGTGYKTQGALTRPIASDELGHPTSSSNSNRSRTKSKAGASRPTSMGNMGIGGGGNDSSKPYKGHENQYDAMGGGPHEKVTFDDDNDFDGEDGRFVDRVHLVQEEEEARRHTLAFGADEEKGELGGAGAGADNRA